MGNWAEADPPGQPLNSSIDLESGREPGHPANSSSRKPAVWDCPAALRAIIVVTMVVVIALVAALIVVTSKQPPPCSPAAPWCLDGWIQIQGKCYYFSKAEENWTYSQSFCSSHAASLAGIESPQELDFLLPYRGKLDHWIGLWKDTGQVWKWVNGTEFDHRFEIDSGADCAYLDEDLTVMSSSCRTPRKWICSKPDTPAKGEERAVGGDS
ncbi:C-type lectin domain family 2 member D-like isoform X2 [Mauremys reevesii]|uniref:C-type lectin domain family 2 member D-like isoform X2 n=1 Tax=Mauremys reevesii TaxID=260615 RepID=UPI00193EDD60|nr:C-type lectin domain family 2 member D-like isoform X2 [Mauremys reevesii]